VEKLLPDRLKLLWEGIDTGQTTVEIAQTVQEQLLDDYRAIWTEALVSDGHGDLKQSLLNELARYLGWDDLNKVEFRCRRILEELRADWQRIVKQMDRASIEQFYDLFELIWWHTLIDDRTPLAYVLALDFARRRPGRRYLDFGAGIGSGALLFRRVSLPVRHTPGCGCCRRSKWSAMPSR
jgi:hypothetical protein